MTAPDLLALALRCEEAGGEQQRELLIEAFDLLTRPKLNTLAIAAWQGRRNRFMAMLDAEAYESAALMLIPEGFGWRLWMPAKSNVDKPRVTIWGTARAFAPRDTEAATAGLAIAASVLRARAIAAPGGGE